MTQKRDRDREYGNNPIPPRRERPDEERANNPIPPKPSPATSPKPPKK
jgi:hypothetical protein